MRDGYYCPILFYEVNAKVGACTPYQMFAKKNKLLSLPLKSIIAKAPFQKSGLDFNGEINHPSSG